MSKKEKPLKEYWAGSDKAVLTALTIAGQEQNEAVTIPQLRKIAREHRIEAPYGPFEGCEHVFDYADRVARSLSRLMRAGKVEAFKDKRGKTTIMRFATSGSNLVEGAPLLSIGDVRSTYSMTTSERNRLLDSGKEQERARHKEDSGDGPVLEALTIAGQELGEAVTVHQLRKVARKHKIEAPATGYGVDYNMFDYPDKTARSLLRLMRAGKVAHFKDRKGATIRFAKKEKLLEGLTTSLVLSQKGHRALDAISKKLDKSSMSKVSAKSESLKSVLNFVDMYGSWPADAKIGYLRRLSISGLVKAAEE